MEALVVIMIILLTQQVNIDKLFIIKIDLALMTLYTACSFDYLAVFAVKNEQHKEVN